MQRNSVWSVLLFLVAIGGVLFAVYHYIQRKREEDAYWDEFDEYNHEYYDDEDEYDDCDLAPPVSANIEVELPDEECDTPEA